MTRYVLADLQQVGDELSRRAAEIRDWLDSVADQASNASEEAEPEPDQVELAKAIAQVDLTCFQALSSAASRLTAAAESLYACASDMEQVDVDIARQMCRWTE